MQNNTLKEVVETFCKEIDLKIRLFREFVPKDKNYTNSDLTGKFFEALIKEKVKKWVFPNKYINSGMFFPNPKGIEKPLQIDGIIHSSLSGPTTFECGDFEIVNPNFCTSVIEVKTSEKISELQKRLNLISTTYLKNVPSGHAMGIIIINNEYDSLTSYEKQTMTSGNNMGVCPIFPLFKEEKSNGEVNYIPYKDSIQNMIVNIYDKQGKPNNTLCQDAWTKSFENKK